MSMVVQDHLYEKYLRFKEVSAEPEIDIYGAEPKNSGNCIEPYCMIKPSCTWFGPGLIGKPEKDMKQKVMGKIHNQISLLPEFSAEPLCDSLLKLPDSPSVSFAARDLIACERAMASDQDISYDVKTAFSLRTSTRFFLSSC
ncbi:hypothetical protein AgCh_020619 [Apium graveolens]